MLLKSLCDRHLSDRHFKKLVEGSGIDPELARLNFETLEGDAAYSALLYALPHEARRNDGRLRDKWLDRYRHVSDGGWWCSGIDLLTFEPSQWGCFKPDSPRRSDKNKPIKYEHPPKTDTEVFALNIPERIWGKIAKRYSVPIPDRCAGFWQWIVANPQIPIVIVEGAKKAAALLSIGYAAIALPGIFNGYRSPKDEAGNRRGYRYLIPQLELLVRGDLELLAKSDRTLAIAFDKDTKPATVKNVRMAISILGGLLERKSCSVRVITWKENSKGIDDLLVRYGEATVSKAIALARPLIAWKSEGEPLNPSLLVNQRYLDVDFPETQQSIAIKSPKGTGKTEAIARNVEKGLRDGRRVLVVVHRIQLAENLAKRFGIDHISQVGESEIGGRLGYALCIDSLHRESQARFNPEEWFGAMVVIDEAEQVLWHLLNSKTCQKKRVPIIETFKELIEVVFRTGGQLFLSDADLSAATVDFFASLAPKSTKPYIIENSWKPSYEQCWEIKVYSENKPVALLDDLLEKIGQGERPLVQLSGQKASSKYGTIALEQLINERYPQIKILRIDSETVADPEHPAYGCISRLNEVLLQYDAVIASPSIETGVSIDVCGHFTSVWTIASGVQSPNSVLQAMARLREPVPRYLWTVPNACFSRIGNGAIGPKQLLTGEHKLCQATIAALAIADFPRNSSQQSFLKFWAEKAATLNFEMGHYREIVLERLANEGHRITFASERSNEDLEEINQEIKDNRDLVYRKECVEISQAPNPDDREYAVLQDKRAKTKEERLKESKGSLSRKYPGIEISPDVIVRDGKGWYQQITTNYYLCDGYEYLKRRDRDLIKNQRDEGGNWIPDLNRKTLTARIEFMKLLSVPQFLQEGAEFTSRTLHEWKKTMVANAADIRNCLGVTATESMSPIQIAQLLLERLGMKLEYLGKRGARGEQERIYGSAVSLHENDNREEVFAQWLERDRRLAEEEAVSSSQPPVSTPPNNIYISTPGYTDSPPVEEGGGRAADSVAPVVAVEEAEPRTTEAIASDNRDYRKADEAGHSSFPIETGGAIAISDREQAIVQQTAGCAVVNRLINGPESLPQRCALLKGLNSRSYAIGWSWYQLDELGHWLYRRVGEGWHWAIAQWERDEYFSMLQDLGWHPDRTEG